MHEQMNQGNTISSKGNEDQYELDRETKVIASVCSEMVNGLALVTKDWIYTLLNQVIYHTVFFKFGTITGRNYT